MKSILQTLTPDSLSVLVFALLLIFQTAFFSTHILYRNGATETIHGIGSPIALRSEEARRSINVKWNMLAANLAASHILSVVLSISIRKIAGIRRPARVFLFAIAVICIIAFVTSIIASRLYWGYYFARPSLLLEVDEIANVKAIIPVKTAIDDSGSLRFVVNTDFSLSESISYAERDAYYCLDARVLLYLKQKHLLPAIPSQDLGDLSGFHSLISKTGLLAIPEEGYYDSVILSGVVIDAEDSASNRLVFAGVTGRQVSNDHYPYYEVLFRDHPQNRMLTFSRGQRFFYDIAGIEGAEWFFLWPALTFLGTVAVLPALTILLGVIRRFKKARAKHAPEQESADGLSSK